MKITEIISENGWGLRKFKAHVRVSGSVVSLGLRAGSLQEARLALGKCYDKSNVISVVEVRDIDESLRAVTKISDVSTQPVAQAAKRDLVQALLTRKMLQRSNVVKPGLDDVQAAAQAASTQVKAADFAHQKTVDQAVRLRDRQHRRRSAR
jgi:hypothetical protein